MNPKAVILSGYFNLIHKGHIEYFQNAKVNGGQIICDSKQRFPKSINRI